MSNPISCSEQTLPETSNVQTQLDLSAAVDDPDCRCNRHIREPLRRIVYEPGDSPDGFGALADEWNPLLQKSRFNTLFLTYEWQTTWWEYLGKGELWILAFRREDTDELVGIAPLYCFTHGEDAGELAGKRRLTLVGCIEVSDYLDVIAARDWEMPVYRELLRWLQSADAPQWDILDLCNLPEESLTYSRLPQLCTSFQWQVRVQQEDVAPQFALPLHYEHYLNQNVDKKQRHEIRRKQRRAERETDVNFYIIGAEKNGRAATNGSQAIELDLDAEMDAFIQLQRASAADKAEFMTPHMQRFFRGMARRMFDAGYLRLCFLQMDGQRTATLLAFDYDNRFLLYNSGFDPDAYSHLSPGWVLLAYSIQYSIAMGHRLFDFMQGDEEYKYRFGSSDYKVMRVLVERS